MEKEQEPTNQIEMSGDEKGKYVEADAAAIDSKVVEHFVTGGMGVVAKGDNKFVTPNKLTISELHLRGAKMITFPDGTQGVDFTPIDEN